MKNIVVKRLTITAFTIAVIAIAGITDGFAQTTDSSEIIKVSSKERKSIELVVREYLLTNPSIIREAMQALDAQERSQKQEKIAETMRSFQKEIFHDPDSPVLGNPKGDVSVVVFFDYNCGYCKSTLPALSEVIAKDPSLRVVYKEFPVLGAQSQVAAQAAMASAKQGKYAAFHDALMKSAAADEATIKSISERLGMNYEKLQKDMLDPALNRALARNLKLADSLGVNGTPSYIVGNQIIPGAIDAVSLTQLIASERAAQAQPKPAGKDVGGMK